MQRASGSAEERLDALWREHAPAVVRYAQRRVLAAEVDEVVAETFLVAWRRLGEVPDYPLPWLLGVARGASANVRRTARRRDALTDRLIAVQGPDAVVEQEDGDALAAPLRQALASLRPEDRELLTLLAWDGLTREEAAEVLSISRGALAVRLHRLRLRLRTQLEPPPDGDQPAAATSSSLQQIGHLS